MRSKLIQENSSVIRRAKPPLSEIRALLGNSLRVLVASHVDPDGDALGSQLAFAAYVNSLGKEALLVRDDDIPQKYRFLSGANEIQPSNAFRDGLNFDTAVILECPNARRIGNASRFLNDRVKIINIDHHLDNEQFGDVNWINAEASSAGEMIYEYFEETGYAIDSNVAELLYTAIMTDTGRFRYRSTSPRTMQIAGKLIEAGANPQRICDLVYYSVQPSAMRLIGKVLNGIEFHHGGRVCLLTLTKDMLVQTEARDADSDGLVDYTLHNAGVKAGVLLKEVDKGRTKVSFRSKDGINVSEIAARYGGGGHFNASGCTIPMSLEKARTELIAILGEAIDAIDE